ncbi:MAG TPA: magnesium-translocating P-type ATPase [Chloroflexia bacterium]|nr:magnesium-translocating P-type ATPase [Chloroflexia bacterium]
MIGALPNLLDRDRPVNHAASGLTSAEAARRLATYGPNDPAPPPRRALLTQILGTIFTPLSLILLLASLASVLLGDPLDAGIIVSIVILSSLLNLVQTYRSQQAAEHLRSQVAPTATVLRDGQWAEYPRPQVVPGDVIRLTAGDLVPADARLIQTHDLHVQEAALTGESLPVEKEAAPAAAGPGPVGTVFLGTSVVSGTATAVVTATGRTTVFGDIAVRLAVRPPETAFERGVRQFGLLITRTVFFLVLFIVLVSTAAHRDAFTSLLFAVSLAVGLTPEFLPMIIAITLAQGAVHMARRQVIVKNLAAIQNFGSIDILCSDKTGTLTSGAMTLDQALDPRGQPSAAVFVLAYLNAAHDTGITNALNTAILHPAHPDPLDAAILQHGRPDVSAYAKCEEIPFDFERRRVSIVVATAPGERLLITKGAPESLLACCTTWEPAGGRAPLDAAAADTAAATYRQLSAQGYRVLAVAYKAVPVQPVYHAAEESGLVLAGYLSFADAPLPDAAAALQALRDDGVAVKILTGDNELVARHVCTQVGLANAGLVLGDELDRMTDPALAHVAEQTTIFARVSPAQKNRIIRALKSRGHVVGYMGDGINDAPSLHTADVGISVASAVDVAKDAAAIILLAPGLAILHNGILEGRKAYGNVMKYLLMGTSSNFGNMFSMAGAFLFLPFLPMLPTQILLNNFLYDLAQITIPTDNVDPSFIRKPHQWDIGLIRNFMIYIGPISSLFDFATFGALLWVFQAGAREFQTGWFVESLATQTLVLFIIRTAGNPLRSRPSRPLAITTLLVVLIGIGLPYSPLAGDLGLTPLPAAYFVFLAGAVGSYLLLVEGVKRRLMGHLLG